MTAWRLFVSDHSEPKVTAVDAVKREVIDTFQVKAPAALYRSSSGAAVFAVQRDGNVVSTISTGIAFDDHGDHRDLDVEAPRLTGAEIAGGYPVHFVEHHGQFAVFFDKEGAARIFGERDALNGKATSREVSSGAPHHGVAVAFGGHDLVSVPDLQEPSNLPVGIGVLDRVGAELGTVAECPDLHGEAASGNILAFACSTGLLVVTYGKVAPEIRHLPYADGLPDGKATTLLGGRGLQYFLGNYGPDKVVLIDPTAEADAFRLVELATRRVHFAVDPVRARFAYVFTEDGQLHQLDVVRGEMLASLKLTDPYSMDGPWSDSRPRVAVAGDNIVVTDPLQSKLHLVDAASFTKAVEIAVEGRPFTIVAVGGSGQTHEGKETHAHHHGDGQIYKGYFEDSQISDRPLSDYAGDWQSVYPYLQDGTLDPVWMHKAENGETSAEHYKAYYEAGYRTDVERITIEDGTVTFYRAGKASAGRYAYDGYEILTYEKGNRGVRFIFRKTGGDSDAPQFIQFSDHKIAPEKADHYHLYWGDDRAELLKELSNWPTYYPASLSAGDIVAEMLAH
ncbi:metallochaperone AztD [Nitratireductor mangrovi]|uniref:Metallochaperone AztD n=2 Tax=Nitratireductor mangrovi TaxID=2599600 RepID=A0A5B8L5Z8_9HYPH|nr:zinc metallochaperone AztD [Nitratireductor mangrovi]QDZ03354.1 metallochaperone AztD [Nitratireductor mangrovi]